MNPAPVLSRLQHDMQQELEQLLGYWMRYTPDEEQGGFYGSINNFNQPDRTAPKGSVLHARILWTFAAAWLHQPRDEYKIMAQRAYDYVQTNFTDHEYGGVYWTVDHRGQPLDTKKQIYALAFTLYAYTAWYRCCGSTAVKQQAIALYRLIEQYSYDPDRGGYLEAFSRDWKPIADLRLSAKDANEKKTMNTHLHVLEAYTALYAIWPDPGLAAQLRRLLYNFEEHIIDHQHGHLHLFFDEHWDRRSHTISYGHDIEAAWLLCEAAEVLEDPELINIMRTNVLLLAKGVTEGLDADGGLWYEYEPAQQQLTREKHWWPQAEALVGFFHAWQLSGDASYLQYVLHTWQFIQARIRDREQGEWFWGVNEKGEPLPNQDKAGLWKCPYHNGRACLEIIRRTTEILSSN